MSYHLSPLAVCERIFGGIERIGPICGVGIKAAYHWRRASQGRAPGDLTPENARKLLEEARRRRIPLRAEHMLFGASVEDVARLLDAQASAVAAEAARRAHDAGFSGPAGMAAQ